MKTFDVQAIEMSVSSREAYEFIQDPSRLPDWTSGFASVKDGRAVMRTPGGEMIIDQILSTSRPSNFQIADIRTCNQPTGQRSHRASIVLSLSRP